MSDDQGWKDVGYHAAIVGKWHLGHADRKYWPRQRGFDHPYGPLLGEEAARVIDGHDPATPLFLHLVFTASRRDAVYGVQPFRAALREGDWKLVWRATLPSRVELFDLAKDPGEQTNLAGALPGRRLAGSSAAMRARRP